MWTRESNCFDILLLRLGDRKNRTILTVPTIRRLSFLLFRAPLSSPEHFTFFSLHFFSFLCVISPPPPFVLKWNEKVPEYQMKWILCYNSRISNTWRYLKEEEKVSSESVEKIVFQTRDRRYTKKKSQRESTKQQPESIEVEFEFNEDEKINSKEKFLIN